MEGHRQSVRQRPLSRSASPRAHVQRIALLLPLLLSLLFAGFLAPVHHHHPHPHPPHPGTTLCTHSAGPSGPHATHANLATTCPHQAQDAGDERNPAPEDSGPEGCSLCLLLAGFSANDAVVPRCIVPQPRIFWLNSPERRTPSIRIGPLPDGRGPPMAA